MTTSIDQQKQVYANQLAAHTLRQWNAVRASVGERKDKQRTPEQSRTPTNERENNSPRGDDNGCTTPGGRSKGRKGPQVVDFASRGSPKHTPTSERQQTNSMK